MKRKLISALILIALTAQLTGCNDNTVDEQLGNVSSDISESDNSLSSDEQLTENSSDLSEQQDEPQEIVPFECQPIHNPKSHEHSLKHSIGKRQYLH